MIIASLAAGKGCCSLLCVTLGIRSFIPLGWLFPQPLWLPPHALICALLITHGAPSARSLGFSLCAALLPLCFPLNSRCLRLSQSGCFPASSSVPLPCVWPANSANTVSWGSPTAHLVCFPSLMDHRPLLFDIQCLISNVLKTGP